MKKANLTKIAIQILKENKEQDNEFISLADARNRIEFVARQIDEEVSYTLDEAKDALARAEKSLYKKDRESFAIQRGKRNRKEAFRIAVPGEDNALVDKSCEIRMNLSKSNGDNVMEMEVIAYGNEVLDSGDKFKNVLQDFFHRANLIES